MVWSILSRAAFVTSAATSARRDILSQQGPSVSSMARFMSSSDDSVSIAQIGRAEMEEIIEDLNEVGREECGYCVIDVRGTQEIAQCGGPLSPKVCTLPLPFIMQHNVFAMDEEDFEETFGFEKPTMDETLVFTCAAGIRSQQAASIASMAGYSKLVNYMGGANEWFTPSFRN